MLHNELPPEAYGPPAVVLDAEGVTAWLGGEAHSSILWSQISLVEIEIVTAADLDYSEAFWRLAGESTTGGDVHHYAVGGGLMLRLPGNRFCIENRASDIAHNMYLGTALTLAAGLEGIKEGIDPGPPTAEARP